MTTHIFSGAHSWETFDIVGGLPDNFTAKTNFASPTRKVLNVIAGLPIAESVLKTEKSLYQNIGVVSYPQEVGCVTTYDVDNPDHPHNDNYIWNSQFDVPYDTLPEYWTTSGTVSLSTDSILGRHSCSIGNTSYIQQVVRLPNYGGSWFVGLYSKANSNFTVVLSWTGGNTTKTVAGTGSWRKTSWNIALPETVNELTIKINGTCICDRIYVSHINEYTHCNNDKPWFIAKSTGPVLYYGVSGEGTERIFMHSNPDNTLCSYPLYATTTATTQKYKYQSINISGDTQVALSIQPLYRTLNSLSDKLIEDYGGTFIVKMYKQGIWYDSVTDLYTEIDTTRVLYISSDSPTTISIKGRALPVSQLVFLTSSEMINYYDSRFNTIGNWLDHYNCEYSGDVTTSIPAIVTLSNMHGSVRMCQTPTSNKEGIQTNDKFGHVIGEFGTSFDLNWLYSGEGISCYPDILDNEYIITNAPLSKYTSSDFDDNTILFTDITGYTIEGLVIDYYGVMYILTNNNGPVIYISDVSLIHPNQTHIPILSKITLDQPFSFSSDCLFGLYTFTNSLHLENSTIAYRIDLDYPYGSWDEGRVVSRNRYTNISVVACDNTNTN